MAEPYERLITEFTVLQNDQTASPTSFNGFIPIRSSLVASKAELTRFNLAA